MSKPHFAYHRGDFVTFENHKEVCIEIFPIEEYFLTMFPSNPADVLRYLPHVAHWVPFYETYWAEKTLYNATLKILLEHKKEKHIHNIALILQDRKGAFFTKDFKRTPGYFSEEFSVIQLLEKFKNGELEIESIKIKAKNKQNLPEDFTFKRPETTHDFLRKFMQGLNITNWEEEKENREKLSERGAMTAVQLEADEIKMCVLMVFNYVHHIMQIPTKHTKYLLTGQLIGVTGIFPDQTKYNTELSHNSGYTNYNQYIADRVRKIIERFGYNFK